MVLSLIVILLRTRATRCHSLISLQYANITCGRLESCGQPIR